MMLSSLEGMPRGAGRYGKVDLMPSSPDPILTIKEAAQRLGISINTLLRLIRETTIWADTKQDGEVGVRESELRRYLAGRDPTPKEK
jgi:excisionase family DNA binding protein